MGKARLNPLESVKMHCRACGHRFETDSPAVEEAEETPWHPWRYSAECPECSATAEQAHWQRNLLRAWSETCGPRTDEGKRRTRFNALTHGLSAKVATYYPARPGGYAHCNGCRYLEDLECLSVGGCLTRTELVLRHLMAYEANDPRMLQGLNAERQAHISALADDMILAILQDGGPRVKTPEWYTDKDGDLRLARYVDDETGQMVQLHKMEAHPLIRPLLDLIAKNGMTLSDQGMTPKVQEDHALIEGQLADEMGDREAMAEYTRRQADALESLAQMIERSRRRTEADPVLLEHDAHEAGVIDGDVVDVSRSDA